MQVPAMGNDAPFNFPTAVARLDHDVGLFGEMIQFFREDSPGLLREIREGLSAGDAQRVERAAHSLKGLSATFDAGPTVTAARRIEEAARNGDLSGLKPIVDLLGQEVDRLTAALEKFLAESAGNGK